MYGQRGLRQTNRPGDGMSHVVSNGWGGIASAATIGRNGDVRGIKMVAGAFRVMYDPFNNVGKGWMLNAV